MHVELVPTYLTHVVWPQVEGFVLSALEYSQGEYTPDQARQLIALGHWALFIASDKDGVVKGAACVQFNNMPNDRVAFVVAIGGKLFTNPETWEQFVKILKSNGATYVEGAARESIARLWTRYGFEEKYRIVGVRI